MGSNGVTEKDTWSSLAMRQYGDALLGMRLAQANDADPRSRPADCPHLRFPPHEELDPDRLSTTPAANAAAMFDDNEASVIAEARYRMVMAMGGSGAVNEAPSSVSHKIVKKVERKTREQRIDDAKANRVDLIESLGKADGQALVLDVKPTRHPGHNKNQDKPTTKLDLAKKIAGNEGKDLILDMKAAPRPRPEDEDDDDNEVTLGDAMAAQDGKAMILEMRATRKKKKKKKRLTEGGEEPEQEIKRGERFGDKLAELDGKAMILDVRASTQRKETAEQKAAKKKNKATEKLFADLAERDGKELVLDLNIQVKDEKKLEALKEKRRLAKKRKRRTGAGSLIPKNWQAEGRVSADDVDDYLEELRDQREFEQDYFDENTDAQTNPMAVSAKETHHRSQRTQRSAYADSGRAQARERAATEGFGAFDAIHEIPVNQLGAQPKAQRSSEPKAQVDPQEDPAQVLDETSEATAAGKVLDDVFGEILDDVDVTNPSGQAKDETLGGPQPQLRPEDQRPVRAPTPPAPPPPPAAAKAPQSEQAQNAVQDPRSRKARPAPGAPRDATAGDPRAAQREQAPRRPGQAPGQRPGANPAPAPPNRAQAGPQRGPRSQAPVAEPKRRQAASWDTPQPAPGQTNLSDWDDDDDNYSGLSGLSGLSGVSKTGVPAGPLPPVSAQDPYAPEVMARLCMLSPGAVMQVARSAPVGAGPVLQLIGGLREAKDEGTQSDLMSQFLRANGADANRTLELLLTT